MADRVRHDEKTIKEAERLYIDGDGYTKIGAKMNISPTTVRRWIISAAKAGRLSVRDGVAYDDEYRQEAIDYYKANADMSISECAYIHGIAATTMARWLRNHGEVAKTSDELRKFDREEIVKRIEAGDKGVDIAKDLGCSEALISKVRRQLKEAAKKQYDHKAILADLRSGMTGAAVAQKHGCSPSLVSFLRRKKDKDE